MAQDVMVRRASRLVGNSVSVRRTPAGQSRVKTQLRRTKPPCISQEVSWQGFEGGRVDENKPKAGGKWRG
jgi:hypothetical protein